MTDHQYNPHHTALLLVDPYNDFMTEGGKLYDAIKETAEAVDMFGNLRKLIPAIRAAGIPVFIVPHHRAHGNDYDQWHHATPFQLSVAGLKPFEKGTWGGEFNEEFGPKDGDVIIQEHWAQSGFANTDLDMQLKQRRIQKIILVGFVANSCIESTGRYGMEMGYHVTLVRDATAAFSQDGMHAAHEVNGPMFAHQILTTDELVSRIPAKVAA